VLVEVSLLESTLDLQFEVLTTYLNDGGKLPQRSTVKGIAHAYLSAPYGIYQTKDGYLALAMGNLLPLMKVLGCIISDEYYNSESWFTKRDEIVSMIAEVLKDKTTSESLSLLEPLGIWCADVLNYQEFVQQEGYRVLGMELNVKLPDGKQLKTTRCPVVIDGQRLYSDKPAPQPGVHTDVINKEFQLL
ncbi:MAG: CoA transferase, partial [Bacteroidota bacterium]|nr:CoA transferase [Bacteroidota bacterium]